MSLLLLCAGWEAVVVAGEAVRAGLRRHTQAIYRAAQRYTQVTSAAVLYVLVTGSGFISKQFSYIISSC